MDPVQNRLRISLLLMRVGVFVVMIFWSLDKLLYPDHAAGVFETFYMIPGLGGGTLAAVGIIQILLEIGFVAGLFKTLTYGYVLLAHLISTLSSWPGYLEPFDNLLFFAAWPMLAACIALFLLRDQDTLLAADEARKSTAEAQPQPS